jgi:hypothetical protein
MKLRNKILIWAGAVCLVTFALYAANPSFNSFINTQFATTTSGNLITIKQSAVVTNITAVSPTGGFAFVAKDSTPTTQFTIDEFGVVRAEQNVILDGKTASTVIYLNGAKSITSLANGNGVLMNDGSGNFSWGTAGSIGGSNVTSLTTPMGAWFVNNVGDGASITNAVALSFTNAADAWGFTDAQTNAIRLRLAMPYDWDCQPVKWLLRVSCTAANTQPNTNVVFAVRGSLIGMGDREDSPTFSSLQWVTNGLSPTAYIQTVSITKFITPGGTLQPTNSILWEIQRLGGATGDTATVATVALVEAQLIYSRTNRTDFPTSTP